LPQRTAQGRIVTESIIAKRLSGIPPCRFGKALMLKLDDSPDHFQVYTGQVRVGTIYKTSGNPTGNQWYWGLNGVQNGPGPFNGFVRTLDDAKAKFAAAWGAWLKAAGLNEDTPTAQLARSVPSGP
jgi:hypothetical protein